MTDGWAVKVTVNSNGSGITRQIYYVHVTDKMMAEEAVKTHISDTQDAKIEAIKTLTHRVLVDEKIPEGVAKRWM